MPKNDYPAGSAVEGAPVLAIRKDSATALAGTDGDYIFLQTDSNGYLRVANGDDRADLDSGVGTDNHSVIAIGTSGSGGHVIIPSTTTPVESTTGLNIYNIIQNEASTTVSKILGTSLTASYQQVFTSGARKYRIIYLFNTCDKTIFISHDGAANTYELDQGEGFSIDYGANGLYFIENIHVKHAGTTPLSGSVRINGIYDDSGE